jgi:hypothetical protein
MWTRSLFLHWHFLFCYFMHEFWSCSFKDHSYQVSFL